MDFSQLHATDFVVGGSVNSSNSIALPLEAIFQEFSTQSTGTKRAKCIDTRKANKKSRIKHLVNQLYILDGVPKKEQTINCVEDPTQGHSGAQSSNQTMVPSAAMTSIIPLVISTSPKREREENTNSIEAPIFPKTKQLVNRQYLPKLCPKLLAKFSHLPINGGSMKRDSGAIEKFSSYPQAMHDGPKFQRVATIATDLCASARDKVYLDSEGAVIGRPPEDFPG